MTMVTNFVEFAAGGFGFCMLLYWIGGVWGVGRQVAQLALDN